MRLVRLLLTALVLLVVLGGLIAGISAIQRRLNHIRTAEKLTEAAPLENAPPMVAFTTVALGGFRGLLADWLWLRSGKLQEDGSYFEMVQLASWIVKLQPRFTAAAAFLGWNMSYNISVCFSSVEDRWRWVQRGIELVRDEALVYNPGDPELYRELGWIFQHKMGQDLDDANRYYKTQFALQMIKAFGEYPPDWQALASAADTEERLRQEVGPGAGFWSVLTAANLTLADLEREFRKQGGFPEALRAPLEKLPEQCTVELYLRRRWLTQVYKLEPELMLKLNQEYGPLDWRLSEAHAIYWATKGLGTADKEINLNCERMVFQSLATAQKGGQLIYLEDIQHLEMGPNIGLVDATDRSYLQAMEKHKDQRSIMAAYENYLVDTVVLLYTFGRREKAQEFLLKARNRYPDKRFRKSLDDFAMAELAEDMAFASYNQAQATVQGYLLQACHRLAIGEYDQAVAFEGVAGKLWEKYMINIGKSTYQRRALPPYPQMKRNILKEAEKVFPAELVGRLKAEIAQKAHSSGFTLEEPAEIPAGQGADQPK